MSTNFAKTLVWKQDYDVNSDVTISAHQMQISAPCHWMKPPMKIFCVHHCCQKSLFSKKFAKSFCNTFYAKFFPFFEMPIASIAKTIHFRKFMKLIPKALNRKYSSTLMVVNFLQLHHIFSLSTVIALLEDMLLALQHCRSFTTNFNSVFIFLNDLMSLFQVLLDFGLCAFEAGLCWVRVASSTWNVSWFWNTTNWRFQLL